MGRKVLVADDDRAMRTLLVHGLGFLGIEDIVEADDGDEALALFQQDKFDLVLLDWEMPGKTGLEVLQAIRSQPSDVPVILVTAKRSRESVVEAAEAGVTDYLVKPIDQDIFDQKLTPYCRPSESKIDASVYRCRNVMNSDVITIKPDATIKDAIALLLKHGISGLPVVDDQKRLLGLVTELNLLKSITQPDLKMEPVSRVMSTEIMTVDEDTIPLKVVRIMEEHHVRRVPVVRGEELVGVISRRDILRFVTENEEALKAFLEELKSLAGK